MLRKRSKYSGALLLLATIACRDKPIDQGALLTARTVGLADLERGRLAEAEREFERLFAEQPNPENLEGLAAARNTGWRAAQSDHLVFLDADDRLLPDALRLNLVRLAEAPSFGQPIVLYVHVLRLTTVQEVHLDVIERQRLLVRALGSRSALEAVERRVQG